ncbi:MAG: hypothetical protein ACR2PM_05525 [Hyphomicrobiales bacterium]
MHYGFHPRRPYVYLLVNCAAGIAASWLLLAGLMWFDTAGISSLVSRSPDGVMAFALLAGGFAVTFGSAAMATAIMLQPYDCGGGDGAVRSSQVNTPMAHRRVPVAHS